MLTFDEGATTDTTAADNEQPGPNSANPGYSPLLNTPIAAYGGLTYYDLLGIKGLTPNTEPAPAPCPAAARSVRCCSTRAGSSPARWTAPARTTTTRRCGRSRTCSAFGSAAADGHGHLGFAATATDFGPDVFNAVLRH